MNKNKQIGATNWPEEMSIQDKFSLNFQESGEKKKMHKIRADSEIW